MLQWSLLLMSFLLGGELELQRIVALVARMLHFEFLNYFSLLICLLWQQSSILKLRRRRRLFVPLVLGQIERGALL